MSFSNITAFCLCLWLGELSLIFLYFLLDFASVFFDLFWNSNHGTPVSWQSLDDLQSKAVEAVLLLQEKINEDAENVSMRLLIPSRNIGCIIGKSGSIINEIRKRTRADIRISKGEKPKIADDGDEYVVVRVLLFA